MEGQPRKDGKSEVEIREQVAKYEPYRVAAEALRELPKEYFNKYGVVERLPVIDWVYKGGKGTGDTVMMGADASFGMFGDAVRHFQRHSGLRDALVIPAVYGLIMGMVKGREGLVFKKVVEMMEAKPPTESWVAKMRLEGKAGLAGKRGVHTLEATFGEIELEDENNPGRLLRKVVKVFGREYLADQEKNGGDARKLGNALEVARVDKTPALPESLRLYDWGKFVGADGVERVRPNGISPTVRILDRSRGRFVDVGMAVLVTDAQALNDMLIGGRIPELLGKNLVWRDLSEIVRDGKTKIPENTNPPILTVSFGERVVGDESVESQRNRRRCEQLVAGDATGFQVDFITNGRGALVGLRTHAGHYQYDGAQSLALTNLIVSEVLGLKPNEIAHPELPNEWAGMRWGQELRAPLMEGDCRNEEDEIGRMVGFGEVVTTFEIPQDWTDNLLRCTKKLSLGIVGESERRRVMEDAIKVLEVRAVSNPRLKLLIERIKAEPKLRDVMSSLMMPQAYNILLVSLASQVVGERSAGYCVAPPSKDRLNIATVGMVESVQIGVLSQDIGHYVSVGASHPDSVDLLTRVKGLVAGQSGFDIDGARRELVNAAKEGWREIKFSEAMMNVFSILVSLSGRDFTRKVLQTSGRVVDDRFVNWMVNMWAQSSALRGPYSFDTAVSGEAPFKLGIGVMDNVYSFRRIVKVADVEEATGSLSLDPDWKTLRLTDTGPFDRLKTRLWENKWEGEQAVIAERLKKKVRDQIAKNFRIEACRVLGTTLALGQVGLS